MLVFTTKISKKKLVTIGFIIVVIIALLVSLCSKADQDMEQADVVTLVETNSDRVAFLQSQGWQIDPTPVETQEVKIPEILPEILEQYNKLQLSQGYDLTQYLGKTVQRYVYEITNYPDTTESYFATLLICDGSVIGGDVASAAQNGLMQGLEYPKTY
ncbi:MAG: DUF4830 domain-containing protein [Eubacteriales bacterium]